MKSNSLRGGRRRRQRRLGESSRGRFRPSVLLESPFRSLPSNEHTADVTERRVDTSQSACRAGREAGNDEAATPIARGEGKGRKLFALSFAGLVPSAALGRRERERELQEKKRVRVPSWSRCLFCTRLSGGWPMRERKESGRTIEFFFLRFARSGLASLILRISFDDTAARKKEERTPVLVGECGHSRSLDPTLLPTQQTPSLFPFVVSAPHSRRQGSRSREIGTLQSFDVRRRVLKQKHTHA